MDVLIAIWLLSGWAPLAFFFAGCPCCGTPCPCCNSTPAQLQVTISGVVDQQCSNCDTFNGTWVMDASTTNCFGFDSPFDDVCFYKYSDTTHPKACADGEDISDFLNYLDGICLYGGPQCRSGQTMEEYSNMRKTDGTYHSRAVVSYAKSMGVEPFDCVAGGGLTLDTETGSSLACDDSAATVLYENVP